MKYFAVFAFLALAAVCYAAPAVDLDDPEDAEIISYTNERSPDNSQYRYHIETSDGVTREESARLELVGKDEDNQDVYVYVVDGFYEYTGPDGVVYRTSYHSNKDGFSADGAHLPHNDEVAYANILAEQEHMVEEQARVAAEIEDLKHNGGVRSQPLKAVPQTASVRPVDVVPSIVGGPSSVQKTYKKTKVVKTSGYRQ